jgi:hypothetical protein
LDPFSMRKVRISYPDIRYDPFDYRVFRGFSTFPDLKQTCIHRWLV